VFLSVLVARPVAKYFVPEALNVAHFIFFALSTLIAYKTYKKTT